ncbi:hypothetical protein [Methylosinus sporium]|uniref:Uncharacterized protein n=1 Tax=Methylosinus sporium TaxID=428 RepID=A0A2U1ST23_METSR|nr:hypothetical protein [Methylosinus sporium]PWB94742.1 hypothetical protein C5689_06710 [Methylosinus sporium]
MSEDLTNFRDSLRKGSGRAALILASNPSNEELQAALLAACKTVQIYDPQCEEGRAPYLNRLIAMTGRSPLYWTNLLPCLDDFKPENDDRDIVQIFGVLCLLATARTGAERRRLRDFVESNAVRNAHFPRMAQPCGEELIRLEGLEVFLLLIRLYHSELLQNFLEEDGWAYRSWVDALSDKDGAVATAAALEKARSISAELDRLMSLAAGDQRSDQPVAQGDQDKDIPSYLTVKATLDPKKGFPRSWIKSAAADDLIAAARDLLVTRDDVRIRAYLRIFTMRDYPLDPETLFPLVNGENRRISWQAVRVLQRLNDAKVRDLAFWFLQKEATLAAAIRLLCGSYQPGDFSAIESAVRNIQLDEDGWHGVGASILSLLDDVTVPPDESREVLLHLYEKTPCSLCRESVVEKLHEHGLVPNWMARECAFDAEPETAAVFQGDELMGLRP